MVISSAALALPANNAIEPVSTAAIRYCIVASLGIESDFPSLRGAKRRSNPFLLRGSTLDWTYCPILVWSVPRDAQVSFAIRNLRLEMLPRKRCPTHHESGSITAPYALVG